MSARSASLLSAAFDYRDPEDQVRALKTLVANELLATDPRGELRFTEFFNHSFAPDMILSWSGDARERQVFLRTNNDPLWLAEDLHWLAQCRPIVISVAPDWPADESLFELSNTANRLDTLVTDIGGLNGIHPQDGAVVNHLAHAVVRGGRGLLNEEGALNVSDAIVGGFTGASQLDRVLTEGAVEAAAIVLEPLEAGRLTRVLQAVWEGNGGRLADFPALTVAGALAPDDLELLVEIAATDSLAFWRDVGRQLTLSDLISLTMSDPAGNLQSLVTANLDVLQARAMVVLDDPLHPAETGRVPRWRIEGECLALTGWGWTAYFAASRDDLPPPEDQPDVPLQELRIRSHASRLRISNIQVRRPDLAITFEATGSRNVIDSKDVQDLAGRDDAVAVSATVGLRSSRRLTCDIRRGVAGGQTSATFDMREFCESALPLLRDISRQQAEEMRSILHLRPAEPEQLELFRLDS